ncbi:hypothetical protein N9K12_03610 [Methylophilaceae bacterium]|nr:hypothetical protein [Methylophilaceae bacterium]
MAKKNTCLVRLQGMLDKSSIGFVEKDEIMNAIKIAQSELKLNSIDEINVDVVAKDVQSQIILQRKINKRNAIEDEIKGRELVDYVLREFPDNPQEGLTSILVGSNEQKAGARASVAVQQHASINQAINGLMKQLADNNVETLFAKADEPMQLRIVRTMYELAQKPTKAEADTGIKPVITEKNAEIIKLATILHEYSEMMRIKLNDRGANIGKIWGYVVRQSHDPYSVRDAAKVLGDTTTEADPSIEGKWDKNYNRNFKAWKNFVMERLDQERTFAGVENIDEFMLFAYNSLIKNENLKSDGAEFTYNAKPTKNIAKSSQMKRVLHFKNADTWFEYNKNFGMGNLNESFFSGLTSVGRNLGIMDTLGTKPEVNFEKIRKAVATRITQSGQDSNKVDSKQFNKFLDVVTGRIYETGSFTGAKWGAITRAIASMAKLGGAVVSAAADLAQYGGEMRYQGRSFFGGMNEAMGSLAKIKNKKDRKNIAQMLGIMFDNSIYDVSGRFQVGDSMSKGWTNAQRTFFKYNLLSWWTNNLKESAMLGMANYFAKQKNIKFDDLNPGLKTLFKQYDINSTRWNIIRNIAMEKADDGTEFINIALLDKITDSEAKLISGLDNPSPRELRNIKDSFKSSVSGMLLDRSTFAVIEPDARVKATLTRSTIAGTWGGEAIRFVGQFKAFPASIIMKTLSREKSFFKAGNKVRGMTGMASIIAMSTLMGYVSMTAKDILKGREPRVPDDMETFKNIFYASFLQGGGLGIYGDVLFQETRSGGDIAASLLGPVPLSAFDYLQAIKYAVIDGEPSKAGKLAYRNTIANVPFLNVFYAKAAFDYLIGHQMMEFMSPGVLKRVEKRMEKDYNQGFIFTKPSQL